MNNSDATVTHEDRRMYFMGRWFWISNYTVRAANYVHRSDYTHVGYGNNADKWFYADYQANPGFAKIGRYRFTIQTEGVPL